MSTPDISMFRQTAAGNLGRYRVGGFTRLTIQENFTMTAGRVVQVAGLLTVAGLLIVKKNVSNSTLQN